MERHRPHVAAGRSACRRERCAPDKREQLARGAQWPEITRLECDIGDLLSRLVAGGDPRRGARRWSPRSSPTRACSSTFPGLVVVGVRADPSDAESRARTQSLARRLKTLADPTRLGIVDHLVRRPEHGVGVGPPVRDRPAHGVEPREAACATPGSSPTSRVGSQRRLTLDPATVGSSSTTSGPCSSPPKATDCRPLPTGFPAAQPLRTRKALAREIKIDKTIFI